MGGKSRASHIDNGVHHLAAVTISLSAGKWTIGLILVLADEKQRFTALQRLLPGISHHVLTKELKRLQAYGIISRTVYPTTPPSVEYELTTSGAALYVVLQSASEWATRFLDKAPSLGGSQRLPGNSRERINSDVA
jgi:DNA-binding HxlR family transcriptional regulator